MRQKGRKRIRMKENVKRKTMQGKGKVVPVLFF
jgi:hypothetical protein